MGFFMGKKLCYFVKLMGFILLWYEYVKKVENFVICRLLQEFVEKHEDGLEVVYALSGWLKSSIPSYHVTLVAGAMLAGITIFFMYNNYSCSGNYEPWRLDTDTRHETDTDDNLSKCLGVVSVSDTGHVVNFKCRCYVDTGHVRQRHDTDIAMSTLIIIWEN